MPFSSLRYESGKDKLWGVHALRVVRHLDEWDSWMPLRRETRDLNTSTFTRFMEQAGHIAGIENVGNERNAFNPFTGQFEPGLRRNGRTFFIKVSYLFRRSL